MAILPVQRNPLDDVSMAEQMKRRSKRRIYLKMFLRVWAIKILLSLLTAMGFPSPHPMCAFPGSPHITSNCSDMVCFQPVSSGPRLLSHLMCLTILHGCHGMQDCWFELFPKLRRFTNNAAPASIPVGLHHPSITLVSLLMGSCRTVQRAATCVPAVAEPPGFERFGLGHGQS